MQDDKRPFFSVLIPTTGRSDLIRMAVTSVLDQTFGDFELIIADSSDTDEARNATLFSHDPRVRYVISPHHSLMTWDFAAKQARGKYVIWFDDDNYFLPRALELFKHEIDRTQADVVTASHTYFYDDKHPRTYLRRSIGIIPWTGETYAVDLAATLRAITSLERRGPGSKLPRFHFSATVFKKEVVDAAIARLGSVLVPDMPNMHSMHLILFPFAKTCACVDVPVVIVGRLGVSMSQIWSTAARTRFKKKPFVPRLSPFSSYARINGILENYLRVQELLPEFYKDTPIGYDRFAELYLDELAYLDTDILTAVKNWKNFFAFLDKNPKLKKQLIKKALVRAGFVPLLWIARRTRLHALWRRIHGVRIQKRRIKISQKILWEGKREFEVPIPEAKTIMDAARVLPGLIKQFRGEADADAIFGAHAREIIDLHASRSRAENDLGHVHAGAA